MKRIIALARKEFLHIIRDTRTLVIVFLWPLIMLFLFGYAINFELTDLPVGILDYDHSASSRELIREATSSGFIVASEYLESRDEINSGFRKGKFKAVFVIPRGYELDLLKEPVTKVQIIIDGADGATAATVDNYLKAVMARLNLKLIEEAIGKAEPPIEARIRFLFNPQLVSANFIVPGIIALVLVMICALLTSIAIAREIETGTMEQILATPILPSQIILGKVLPYLFVAAVNAAIILLVGHLVFKVPMNGSWLALAGYCTLYLLISLGLGLMVSSISKTQQVAMMMALMATLLPTLLLSGFIFPRESMPLVLQYLSYIVPATYFVEVIRGVMLIGRNYFPFEAGIMFGMAVLLLAISARMFKVRLSDD